MLAKRLIPSVLPLTGIRTFGSDSDGVYKMGRLRRKYTLKEPIVRIDANGTVFVEGVSNKQTPIPVPWLQPKHYSRVEPGAEGSGDLDIFPEPDLTQPRLEYQGCKALEEAPEEVRRLLSLEMAKRSEAVLLVKEKCRLKVAEHKHDVDSLAVRISNLTMSIRNDQKALGLLARDGLRDQQRKRWLKHRVDMRRADLEALRKLDYKKFEWLLEKLDLVYKPRPFTFERVLRHKHTERLTNFWCDEQRHFRLEQLKEKFEEDQSAFLLRKAETLRSIMEEEAREGLEPTVSQADVDTCLEKARQVKADLEAADKHYIDYHIFREEKAKELD